MELIAHRLYQQLNVLRKIQELVCRVALRARQTTELIVTRMGLVVAQL